MRAITAILTTYRRPHTLPGQVQALRAQSVPAQQVWVWANEPGPDLVTALARAGADRVVTCSSNAYFHARFALALTVPTPYVALFDDDALPGPGWFANCLETMAQTPGILGTAGVTLLEPGYHHRSLHGWHDPSAQTVEVDLVGHAWFLRTEWLRYLFAAPPVLGTNGEDIELAARAWRLGGVRCYCPPHPAQQPDLWGSTRGQQLGSDSAAASRRAGHLEERECIVRAEMAAGWAPLYLRAGTGPHRTNGPVCPLPPPPQGDSPRQANAGLRLPDLIPETARQILLIAPEAAGRAAALQAQEQRRIHVLAQDKADATLQEVLDGVPAGEAKTPGCVRAPFDCIVWDAWGRCASARCPPPRPRSFTSPTTWPAPRPPRSPSTASRRSSSSRTTRSPTRSSAWTASACVPTSRTN